MKKLLILSVFFISAASLGQTLNSLTKSAKASSSKVLNNDYIDKIASDQVSKLTKKLSLSESQQTKANEMVMGQLRSPKFQDMLSKFTPEQLLSADASEKIGQAMLKDPKFTEQLGSVLNKEQQETLKKSIKL
jgi:hypothetical protein